MTKVKIAVRTYLVILLFSFASISVLAQEEKKNILVVPFAPYHFLSSFDLQEMANFNKLSSPGDVVDAVQDGLLKGISTSKSKFNFTTIPPNEYQAIKHLIDPEFIAEPTGRYGIDLSKLKSSQSFQTLLKNFNIDYVLFLTHYRIDKKLYTSGRSFDGSYAIAWSSHLLDYELINAEENLVAMAREFEIKPNAPTLENYFMKGLLLSELNGGHRELLKDIQFKIEQFNETKEAQFKVKRKRKSKRK